ncbi:uncharacterized protein LOC135388595 [Ornithodoros turicata]|uniref:uncharacterized protein LOC135388595 n=1 Tax=Ornithodoros turicata TaxID=34597 RepID=UPI003139CF74
MEISGGSMSSPIEEHNAIKEWLVTILGEDVPVYENDDTSIRVLTKLMEISKRRNLDAQLEILRYKEDTNLANQDAHILSDLLCSAGIKPSYLARSLRCHLQALRSVACLGSSDDVSLESNLLTVAELQQQMSEIRDLVDTKKKEVNELKETLEAREKKLRAAAEAAPSEYKKFKTKQQHHMKDIHFYRAKQQEYEKKRNRLPRREVDETFIHEEIVAYHRNLEYLQEQQKALQEQLKPYHGLQPDEATILHMLNQKKMERDTLEKDLQRKISQDFVQTKQ